MLINSSILVVPMDRLHSEQIGTMLSIDTGPPFFSEMMCPPINVFELMEVVRQHKQMD